MKKSGKYLRAHGLGSQIVLLVVLAVMLTFALYAVLSLDIWRKSGPPQNKNPQQAALDLVLRPLARADVYDPRTDEMISAANTLAPELMLRVVTATNTPPRTEWMPVDGRLQEFLTRLKAVGYSVNRDTGDLFVIELKNGTILASELFPPIPPPRKPNLLSSSLVSGEGLLLLLVIIPLVLFWVANKIARQLRVFATAADKFSIEGPHEPLPENGAAEIRMAARAFNRMRDRLVQFSVDRTRMLAAIGHDLRTPVTRMRLRTDHIEDPELRTDMLRDISRMDSMIDSVLSFLRDGRSNEDRTIVDGQSLVYSLGNEFADIGSEIEVVATQNIQLNIDVDAITRALENLLHNSFRQAKNVRLTLHTMDDEHISIDVEDDGPGIPSELREEYLKPFVSGIVANSDREGHFGLGLSIANSIAVAHGGRLELLDSDMGGVLARMVLPKTSPQG